MKLIKYTITLIGFLFLIWFLLPFILQGILNSGNIIGIFASGAVFIYGLLFYRINFLILKIRKYFFGKLLTNFIAIFLFCGILLIILFTFAILFYAGKEIKADTTVIVLGCRVREDGPSQMLSERIDAAYEFLIAVPESKCILSGGKGEDEPMSEAKCMYDCLVARGIDSNRLFIEEKSASTEENLGFSADIIFEEGLKNDVTLITNNFHQFRATLFAKNNGLNINNYSASTNLVYLPTYFIRELCGVLHYFIFN